MPTNPQLKELLEELAEIEHEQWIAWSKHIVETEKITPERLARWQELWRPYSELTEAEKDQDREWAKKVLTKFFNKGRENVSQCLHKNWECEGQGKKRADGQRFCKIFGHSWIKRFNFNYVATASYANQDLKCQICGKINYGVTLELLN